MSLQRLCLLGVVVAAFTCCAQGGLVGPELWWYDSTNIQDQNAVNTLLARMNTAAAAGYTGVVLSDFKMGMVDWDPSLYIPKLNQVKAYAAQKGIKITMASFPFGYSEAILRYDKNLAEGIAVNGATFTVAADGKSLLFNPRTPTTTNLGFDTGSGTSITGWSLDSGRAVRDTTTYQSGTASMKIAAYNGSNSVRGYGIETINVQPYEQIHVSFYAKTQNFSGDLMFKAYDAVKGVQRDCTWDNLPNLAATQTWTKYDLVFDTNNSTKIELRLGSWGTTTGTAWFDNVAVEEVPLHNLVQTATGSPLKIYRPDGTALTQGTDVNTITDPSGFVNGSFSAYHTPPTVTINPATSKLKPGDTVKMDYYAVPGPIYNYESGASLTEPNMWAYCDKINANIKANFPAGTGVMLGYDEMRQMGTNATEQASGLTPGQILANHASTLIAKVKAVNPGDPLFTWNDMFDPNHNAGNDLPTDNYYYVPGDMTGSWNGLTHDVTIMNWNRSAASLQFFANLGNPQLISGFYDSGSGTTAATNELATAGTIPGVRGLMYTTWANNYSQMTAYATAAKAAWRWRQQGDTNFDGKVDDNDLSVLLTQWGAGTMWEQGNLKGSGFVDDNDLSLLLDNWGASGAVPEPATLTLLALAGAAMVKRRRAATTL